MYTIYSVSIVLVFAILSPYFLYQAVRYRKYVQWIAGEQWTAARSRMSGVSPLG